MNVVPVSSQMILCWIVFPWYLCLVLMSYYTYTRVLVLSYFLFLLVRIFPCLSSIRERGCEIWDLVLDLLSVLFEVFDCTFGFIYIYLLRFATWEAMPRVKVLKRVMSLGKIFIWIIILQLF